MLTFLRTRLAMLTALALTLLAFYTLLSLYSVDAEWMLRWNHVDSSQVQLMYGVLIVVLLLALPFALRIQKVLQRFKLFVFILALVASFLSIHLLEPVQEQRLFVTPFSIWVIIAHILALSGITVWVAMQSPDTDEITGSALSKRLLIGLYAVVIVVLISLHIASAGEFLKIDTPDEPWLASMATNYAENNDLSPAFIGSSYGSPDPILPRYYLLMGLWVKSFGSSLIALRMMPILILALTVVIMAWLLWRNPAFTTLQRLGGLVILLSVSVLVRMSHNLRADVGLAVYSAVIVGAFLQLFGETRYRKRWATISGLALYIGLETIPFIALILAAVAGVMFILWLVMQRRLRSDWQPVIIYGICCGLALCLYAAVRFLPDIQTQLSGYQRFNGVYSGQTGLGTLHNPLDSLINYHLRFSLILSPVELVLVIAAFILCWRWGTSPERWLLMTFGIALIIMQVAVGFTFSYWTLFVPLVAYAAACALRSRRALVIGSFVLMPALVAAPVYDMVTAIQTRPNQTYLTSLDQLTEHVPVGTRLVGESALWFTLHSHRYFIGVDGFWVYTAGHQEHTVAENIKALEVNALLCSKGNTACDDLIATGLFAAPEVYDVNNSLYLLYWRLNT